MDGLNLPRHIVERFERRWAQKLKALAPTSAKIEIDQLVIVASDPSHEGDSGLRTWPGGGKVFHQS
jgi:hypothetical protein